MSGTSPVRESVVDLGPNDLFGVVSEPLDGVQGPLIVMVNGVHEDHVGPARLLVELSRRWAQLGLALCSIRPERAGRESLDSRDARSSGL